MCPRFQFCTHQRVCILHFLKKVEFVVPYWVSMHQCSVPRPSPGREMRGGGGFDGQSFEENKGGSVSVSISVQMRPCHREDMPRFVCWQQNLKKIPRRNLKSCIAVFKYTNCSPQNLLLLNPILVHM
jgi:hypothetical protein